jgi:hypothetical protein
MNTIKHISRVIAFILLFAFFSTVIISAVITEVMVNKNVDEGCLTEKIQVLLVAGCFILYAIHAIRNIKYRLSNSLIAILFLLFFVRELDAFFDNVFFHGAWFYIVLIILIFSFLYYYKRIHLVLNDFLDFTKTPKFLLLVWGLISLLLLSRLLGYKEIWKTLFVAMPIENITDFEVLYRPFKNVVEESVEIISYLALFLSALDPFSVKE